MKLLFWNLLTDKEVEAIRQSAPVGYHLAKNPVKVKKQKKEKGGNQ